MTFPQTVFLQRIWFLRYLGNERLRACDIMEAKIMKYYALSCELPNFWWKNFAIFKIKLNVLTDILLQAQTENSSNSQFVVFTNLHLFFLHGSSFVRQFAISLEKPPP